MAIEAGRAAMANAGDVEIDAVYVATNTATLIEKSTAASVAAGVADGNPAAVQDFGGGYGAGLSALSAACDAVDAGTHQHVLVVASELRTEAPGTPGEIRVGDGAAAVVVDAGGGTLELRGRERVADEFAGQWKRADERFRRAADGRLAGEMEAGGVDGALTNLYLQVERAPADLDRATVSSLDARSVARALKRAGVPEEATRPDDLQGAVGHLGAAHPLALLTVLVDGAPAGSQIALASGSDGVEGWWFESVGDVGTNGAPAETEEVQHYGRYLRARGLLPAAPATPMEPFTSSAMLQREAEAWWQWRGRKCEQCGTVLVLPLPACHSCRGERFDAVDLARTGTVFTVTAEHYMPSPEPPTGMVVIDLDGGGRATVQWAGGAGDVPAIGDRVRLVLRKYHEAEGMPHYWWKAVSA